MSRELHDQTKEIVTSIDDVFAVRNVQDPYPGLRPFRDDENDLFFGREGQIEALGEKLTRNHFVAVVGPSGCGKSSLVQAGLLPELKMGFIPEAEGDWRIAIMRPGAQPLAGLAAAIVNHDGDGGEDESSPERVREIGMMYATLRRGSLGLFDALAENPLPPDTKLLILVDQFEEIFRFRRESSVDEADAFVSLLLKSVERAIAIPDKFPVYVVMTMRSDFIGQCNQFAGLPEEINESQFLTPRMSRDQRRGAVVGPARHVGGKIAPDLVNRLLNDMGDDPDQLPIMQHALMRMWTLRKDASADEQICVTAADYEGAGGWKETLSRHADEAFDELDDDQERIAEVLFRCLTEPGPDQTGVRRPVKLAEVAQVAGVRPDEVRPVVERFREAGRSFLTPSPEKPLEDDTVLDISHESLIRQWNRLHDWVEAETNSAATYVRLEDTAARWQAREEDFLRPPGLDIALKWRDEERPTAAWASRYGKQFELATRFLDESSAEHLRRVRKERLTRRLLFASFLTVVGLIAAVAVGYAIFNKRQADKNLQNYKANLSKTAIARGSRECQTEALIEGLSWFLIAAMNAPQKSAPEKNAFEQAELGHSARALAAGWGDLLGYRIDHDEKVTKAVFSTDGKQTKVVTKTEDGKVHYWDATNGNQLSAEGESVPAEFGGHESSALRLAQLSQRDPLLGKLGDELAETAEGLRVVFGPSEDVAVIFVELQSEARLWNGKTGESFTLQHEGGVLTAAFSSDGETLVTGSTDAARLWNVMTGKMLGKPLKNGGSMATLVFGPDDRLLVSGSGDGRVQIWDVETQIRLGRPMLHDKRINSVAFSPSGKGDWIVTASDDRTARRWNVAMRRPSLRFTASGDSRPLAVGFQRTSGGQATVLVAANPAFSRAEILSWKLDLKPGKHAATSTPNVTLADSSEPLFSPYAAFSPNVKFLVQCINKDGKDEIHLWDLSSGNSQAKLIELPSTSSITDVAISHDGKTLVTGSTGTDAVQVWEVATGKAKAKGRPLDRGLVKALSIGPAGDKVLTAKEKTVRQWRIENREPIGLPMNHPEPITAVTFSLDGKLIVTASEDNSVRLWDAGTGEPIGQPLFHPNRVVALCADAQTLVATCQDGRIWLWEIVKPISNDLTAMAAWIEEHMSRLQWKNLLSSNSQLKDHSLELHSEVYGGQ